MVTTNHFSEITRCTKEFYKENTHGEEKYYENKDQEESYHERYYRQKSDRFQYCVDDPDLYLKGTRDSPVNGEDSAYVVYEIHRCSEKTILPGYPKCASKK